MVTPVNPSLAQWLVDQLEAWGVRRVYGVVGDAILPLASAFEGRSGIRFIPARHEEAAAFMAKADAVCSGTLGVCVATSGPGAAHLVNGLADATTDSVPVMAITGQVESARVGTVHKQEIDQQRLLSPVVGYTARVENPLAAPEVVGRALRRAWSARTTAHISIPKDFWQSPIQAPVRPFELHLDALPRSESEVIRKAATILEEAERPAILAGAGARGATGEVLKLAEHLSAPVIYSLAAGGQFPGRHHLVIGGIGEGGSDAATRLLAESDGILRIGTTWWPREYVPENPRIVDVNIRPEHAGMGVPSAYVVLGPSAEVVPELARHIGRRARPAWENRIRQLKDAWSARLTAEAGTDLPRGVHPAALVHEFSRHLPPDALVALDVGEHVLWFNRHFRGSGGQDVLFSGYWRTMGFGLPAAIAAHLARPDRPVLALVGDGGFAMTMAEMSTAVRFGARLVVVVVNNASLAMEENEMKRQGLAPHGVSLNNPDFARYAALCGAFGIRVERRDQLAASLKQALSTRGPALIDVVTAPVPLPLPEPLRAEPALV